MTHEQCKHFTVDGSAYCDRCKEEWYIDTGFTMNDVNYTVWQSYGADAVTGEDYWICKRDDGNGCIYITSADIDNAIGQTPYWEPEPINWHDVY